VRFLDYRVSGRPPSTILTSRVSKKTVDVRFCYCLRIKIRLKEERRRSSKLSLSCLLSYFFLSCVLCFSVESKYSCKLLVWWPDVFLCGRRHSLVNVQDRVFPLI